MEDYSSPPTSSCAPFLSLKPVDSYSSSNCGFQVSGSVDGFSGLVPEMEAPVGMNIGENRVPKSRTFLGFEHEGKSNKKRLEKKVKKPRFAFQTRSQVDILDDGYRWRKYGQKSVKNNKFPRSYYRCTFQGCNVKKQVQRLTGDEEFVVTTYEGVHSHPIEKSTENFEHILSRMQIYAPI